jgi:preprotein translocase subunit YajC
MIAVVAGGFWFFVMRPAKARQQAQFKVIKELSVGDKVMTTAGLFGTIRDITDADVGLEIAEGVVVRYVREAVAKTITEPITSHVDSTQQK